MPEPSLKDVEKRGRPPQGEAADELQFTLEQWSADTARIEQVIARLSNGLVARAAFDELVRLRPKARIRPRQRTRLICDSARRSDLKLDERAALDIGVAERIDACGGDPIAALRAAIVANHYQDAEIERLTAAAGRKPGAA